MQQLILDKRTADDRLYDIDCSFLLEATEVIQSVTSIADDQGQFTYSGPSVNVLPITYPNGTVAQPGKVVQVYISGGTIPANAPWVMCAVRCLLVTSLNPALEATVLLRLVNNPGM